MMKINGTGVLGIYLLVIVSLYVRIGEAQTNGDPVYAPLYKIARLFTESLNYTFQRAQGSYFLRLHFYPFSFKNHNVNESSFDVEANGVKLVTVNAIEIVQVVDKQFIDSVSKVGGNGATSSLSLSTQL